VVRERRSCKSGPPLFPEGLGGKIHQKFNFTFIFRSYEGGRLVREESEPFALSYYTYPHLEALFQMAGLEVAKEYGSFAKTPLDNTADQMIFLLRRARR
jgi:hypothetical protein